ncbi:hypothetical protein RCH10_003225 [Variovorax sp. GrIS 2.14]
MRLRLHSQRSPPLTRLERKTKFVLYLDRVLHWAARTAQERWVADPAASRLARLASQKVLLTRPPCVARQRTKALAAVTRSLRSCCSWMPLTQLCSHTTPSRLECGPAGAPRRSRSSWQRLHRNPDEMRDRSFPTARLRQHDHRNHDERLALPNPIALVPKSAGFHLRARRGARLLRRGFRQTVRGAWWFAQLEVM